MNSNSNEEQSICIRCGFCCDGTLFDRAHVKEKEIVHPTLTHLVHEFEGDTYFKLPCPNFDTKCTIYCDNKPKICSSFRCKILREVEKEMLNRKEADHIIDEVKKQRAEIFSLYEELTQKQATSIRAIHMEVLDQKDKRLELLKIKCTLLSILLVKHFKTNDSFEQFLK